MKLHANAKTCPNSRGLIAERVLEKGWSLATASAAAGVRERTASKWIARFRARGAPGRSSPPRTGA
jgi:hypothetical protein